MDTLLHQNLDHSYLYIWKFQVLPDKEAEFQRMYGPEGAWVRLFRQSADYMQTLLLKDLEASGSYTTVDIWKSEAAFKIFKGVFAAEYETLDKQCEHLTESEEQIGRFEVIF